mgnify:CR=1 FL=1
MTTPSDTDDVQTFAEDLVETFADHADLNQDDVADKIAGVIDEYGIPASEAYRSVKNNYMSKHGLEPNDLGEGEGDGESNQGNSHVLVGEINQDEQWVDVTVKVDQLWEPNSDSVGQVGLVGDESGKIKFLAWAKSDLPELEEGQSYELTNVVTDEYQGDYSIKLNKTTGINPIDDDVEIGENSETMSGAIVELKSGSGLIARCAAENCTRTVTNSPCSEHGKVDGENDLRIKAVLDTGREAQTLIFNEEATEELTGISLSDAEEMARENYDRECVAREIQDMIVGLYYEVTGPMLGEYLLVNSWEETPQMNDPEEVLLKARSI